MSRNNRPPHQSFSRLSLEQLETREVPATFRWLGRNADFNDSINWQLTDSPATGDTRVFSGAALSGYYGGPGQSPPPPPGSPPPPTLPPPNVHRSVSFPNVAGLEYLRIRIEDGYTGVVSFPQDIKFGFYVQSAGSTFQVPGTALTVTTNFEWTRGAININTTAPAFYNLAPLATGAATPFEGGSVSLGSTINLQGDAVTQRGARLALNDGTYNVTHRQVSLHAMQFSLLELTPGAPVPQALKETDGEIKIKDNTTDNPEPTKKVIIDPKATASIVTVGGRRGIPRMTMTGDKPLVENNGKFTIDKGAKLVFAPDDGQDGAGGGLYQNHEDAITELTSGSSVICGGETSVDIMKGRLELKDAPGTTQRDTEQDPIIIKKSGPVPRVGLTLSISANSILTHDANNKGFVKLEVGGHFGCYGVLNLVASRVAEKSDTVVVSHEVFFGNKPMTVDWYSETGDTMAAGKGWTMISSENKGGAAKPIDSTPTVTQTNPGNFGITLDTELNAAKDQFKVKIK
jgi:hypothetical protein